MNKTKTESIKCLFCGIALKTVSNDVNIRYCPNDCLSKFNLTDIPEKKVDKGMISENKDTKHLYERIRDFFDVYDKNNREQVHRGNHIACGQGIRLIESLTYFNRFLADDSEFYKRMIAVEIKKKLNKVIYAFDFFLKHTEPTIDEIEESIDLNQELWYSGYCSCPVEHVGDNIYDLNYKCTECDDFVRLPNSFYEFGFGWCCECEKNSVLCVRDGNLFCDTCDSYIAVNRLRN